MEDDLAKKSNAHFSINKWEQTSYEYKQDSYVAAHCIDYTDVHPNNRLFGYFVYATMEKEPDILIKVRMPPDADETVLLDWALNNRRVIICLKTKLWRGYISDTTGVYTGDGYGMYIGSSIKEVVAQPA